jgi:3-phosphoshikimate 1-carboxyvinyltransferase
LKPFAFVGKLQASKSILNRLLLMQSYDPENLRIAGDSDCDDVRLMKSGLIDLAQGRPVDAGAAGSVFRFLALRASRLPGKHRIQGTKRLMERPQDELLKIFRQLGVAATQDATGMNIESRGWKPQGDTLLVPSNRSSQFVSGVLLNAWDLPFDLYVSAGGKKVSEGYFQMTLRLVERLGLKLDFWDGDFRVRKAQRPMPGEYSAEIDMGSAFALAAVAAVNGKVTLTEFPPDSLQPDSVFVSVLEKMGVPVLRAGDHLRVEKAPKLNGVIFEIDRAPDLFPVLAALAALAEGPSHLFGGPQLVHKESNRLQQMGRLLTAIGRDIQVLPDGMKILGDAPARPGPEKIVFDCDEDHRLAFAAAVLVAAGFNLEVRSPEVVRKSFPEFWSILGWGH